MRISGIESGLYDSISSLFAALDRRCAAYAEDFSSTQLKVEGDRSPPALQARVARLLVHPLERA